MARKKQWPQVDLILKTIGVTFEKEFKFHPKRGWLLDYAFPDIANFFFEVFFFVCIDFLEMPDFVVTFPLDCLNIALHFFALGFEFFDPKLV